MWKINKRSKHIENVVFVSKMDSFPAIVYNIISQMYWTIICFRIENGDYTGVQSRLYNLTGLRRQKWAMPQIYNIPVRYTMPLGLETIYCFVVISSSYLRCLMNKIYESHIFHSDDLRYRCKYSISVSFENNSIRHDIKRFYHFYLFIAS